MSKFDGVHPVLVDKASRILHAMAEIGHPMMVTDGLRTLEEQQNLYLQGRTRPGPIVTKADGTNKKSNHQAREDGYGHALDLAFLVDGKPSWSELHPWRLYGEMAKALGLRWGGDFETINDRPHIELP